MVNLRDWTRHMELIQWIEQIAHLTNPDSIHLCDGSFEEYQQLTQLMCLQKTAIALNPSKRPNSFLVRSNPHDVARIENRTFICSPTAEQAGPTNHWADPKMMKDKLRSLFQGAMRGRTMYVIPFCMGPLESPMSLIGIEITDSPYVVCNMAIMTGMGKAVLDVLGTTGTFIPCLHSVGVPLKEGKHGNSWPCQHKEKYIAHFPQEPSIWSYGSGYGGNALLGKKCLALRIASAKAGKEGWLAEHMLIIRVTSPEGKSKYFVGAFPSACGKTNLAMLKSTLDGWEVTCVGDDIAWMHVGKDGKIYAINPETGFFGVAPGTSYSTNPNVMQTIKNNTIFTNVALTEDQDVWWEGMSIDPPPHLTDWQGNSWNASAQKMAAHPNSRFTAPIDQCPVIDPAFNDPEGVPIEGIIFGGRRTSLMPLVFQSFSWEHGVFLGTAMSSETTSAAAGEVGKLRHDPFAMLPFCGYHMGEYFQHWLAMGKKIKPSHCPKIFHVNWFRKSSSGNFLWPGFGENIRVLKWMFERIEAVDNAENTAIGFIPKQNTFALNGLDMSASTWRELFAVDPSQWQKEIEELQKFYKIFGEQLPSEITKQLHQLQTRLGL